MICLTYVAVRVSVGSSFNFFDRTEIIQNRTELNFGSVRSLKKFKNYNTSSTELEQYIDIKHHYIRELVREKEVAIEYCAS